MERISEAINGQDKVAGVAPRPSPVASLITSPFVNFLRHFLEMSVAMLIGMLLLGPLCQMLMSALGYSDPVQSAPWLAILLMAFAMSLPMVLWMIWRGHTWWRSLEMAASMFVPAAALIALWAADVMSGCQAHCALHMLMWPAMLLVMVIRYKDYSGHHGDGRTAAES